MMSGRPEPGEAASFYSTYIDRITETEIMPVLIAQLDESIALFESIPEEQSLKAYAPGKWTLRELLGHINDTERAFAFRALWFARGFDSPLPGFDQDVGIAGAGSNAAPWRSLIDEFRAIRQSTIALYTQMPPEGWTRGGIASGNHVTVRALAYIIAGHVSHHAAILRERYLPAL